MKTPLLFFPFIFLKVFDDSFKRGCVFESTLCIDNNQHGGQIRLLYVRVLRNIVCGVNIQSHSGHVTIIWSSFSFLLSSICALFETKHVLVWPDGIISQFYQILGLPIYGGQKL